jgi:hypothetical protein
LQRIRRFCVSVLVGDEKILVGSTGTVQNNGTLKIKNGGLKDKIVEGHQFAKQEENILGQHK